MSPAHGTEPAETVAPPIGDSPSGGWEPMAAGAASFLLLTWLGPGGVWLRDAGQLSAASWSLGVAHPTGFPVVMLLGRLATLVPVGAIAWRIALLSAACAAAAAGLAAATALALLPRTVGRAGRVVVAGVAAAVLLASPTWWLHAVAMEVYAPTALAIVGGARLLVAALQGGEGNGGNGGTGAPEDGRLRRPALLLAALTGLSTGLHVTAPLCLGAMGLVLLGAVGRRAPGLAWRGALAAAAGALVQGYLVAAASHDPWRNWGDPSTPSRALAHATGATIRQAFEDTIGVTHPIVLGANLHAYAAQLVDGMGWTLLLAGAGLAWCVRGRAPSAPGRVGAWAAGALGFAWLTDAAFTVLVNPMGIVDRQTGIPSLVVTAVLVAVGTGAILTVAARAGVRRSVAAAAAAGLVAGGLAAAPQPTWACDVAPAGGWAELWGRAALAQAPPGALVATSTDDTTGVLTFLLGVEGARPDVAHVVLPHVYDPREVAHWRRLYGDRIPDPAVAIAAQAEPGLLDTPGQQQVVRALLRSAARSGTPLVWELGQRDLDALVRRDLRSGLPLWWPERGAATIPTDPEVAERLTERWQAEATRAPDAAMRRLLALAGRSAALVEVERGRPALAVDLLADAARRAPREVRVLANLSTLVAGAGRMDEALALARRVEALDPAYVPGRLDLASLLLRAGQPSEAEEHAATALSLATRPAHRARAHVLLGRVALAAGDAEGAMSEATKALGERPGDPDARELEKMARGER